MTPFAQFVLIDALFLALLVCSLVWVFKTSIGPIWIKIALAIAFGALVCWSPLATRAILGTPQPRSLAELPDKFQLLALHTNDDKAFDLWIAAGATPLAVTVTPDQNMRQLLREATQKLGHGQPVTIERRGKKGKGQGQGAGGEEGQGRGEGHSGNDGSTRTHFDDDQTRFQLVVPSIRWDKNGGSNDNH